MRALLLFFIILIGQRVAFGQCPTADISLTSQSEVDSFKILYPDCREFIEYSIVVSDVKGDITNLDGLSLLTEVWAIDLIRTQLKDLKGLERLKKVYGEFKVSWSDSLTSFSGLDSIRSIGWLISQANPKVTSFSGLESLDSLFTLDVRTATMVSFELDGIRQAKGINRLLLSGNIDIRGLEYPESIESVSLQSNEGIQSFDDLRNGLDVDLQSISIEGYEDFSFEGIDVYDMPLKLAVIDVVNLDMDDVSGYGHMLDLTLTRCESLTDLEALVETNLKSLWINSCNNLESLSDLDALSEIESFSIYDNARLSDISCLASVDSVNTLFIIDNPSLSRCDYPPVCKRVIENSGGNYIQGNGTGCETPAEVKAMCLTSTLAADKSDITVYPNPTKEWIYISTDGESAGYTIYSLQGKKCLHSGRVKGPIDISGMSSGAYIIKINTADGITTTLITVE
jgi:hypothetical protein